MGKYLLSVVAYIVATFALGFGWHLMVFEAYRPRGALVTCLRGVRRLLW